MGYYISSRANVFIAIFWGIIIAFLIWKSDFTQKRVAPVNYWGLQVKELELRLRNDRSSLRSAQQQLEKFAPDSIRAAKIDSLVLQGIEREEAIKFTSTWLSFMKMVDSSSRAQLREDSVALQNAKRNLLKYQKEISIP